MTLQATLSPDSAHVLLRFSYDEALVAKLRAIPGARFRAGVRAWAVPIEGALTLTELSRLLGVGISPDGAVLSRFIEMGSSELSVQKLKAAPSVGPLPLEMPLPALPPKSHQLRGLSLGVERPFFSFFWEMRTGKTYLGLTLMAWRKALGEGPFVIVAPASILHVWEAQAKEHQPGLRVLALTGTLPQRRALLKSAQADAFVVNPEALSALLPDILALNPKVLLVDESHRFRHHSTAQWRALRQIAAKTPRRYLLTGTPAPNSPLEYWAQFALLDPAILGPSFYAFRNRYARLGGYRGKQVVGYQGLEELQGRLRAHSMVVKQKECLDLPPVAWEIIPLDLSGDQKKAYDEMKRDLVTEVQGTEIAATVLVAKLMKLRQILTGFVYDENGQPHFFKDNVKRQALGELLDGLPKEAKVVVWGLFRPELDWVQALSDERKMGYVRLDGSTATAKRPALVEEFRGSPACRVFIGQQQSGGLGLDLSSARYSAFLTNDFDPSIRAQAEARLDSEKQRTPVTHYDMSCRATVDVTIRAALKRKQKLSDYLNRETISAALDGMEDA